MRLMGVFLTICVAMAALQVAARVLALVVISAIVCFAIVQPKQTLGWLAGLMCLGVIARFPVAAILTIGAVVVAGKLAPNGQ